MADVLKVVVMKLSPAQQITLRQISLQPGPQRVTLWNWSTLLSLYRRGLVAFWIGVLPIKPSFLNPMRSAMCRRLYRVEVTRAGRDEAYRLRGAEGVS